MLGKPVFKETRITVGHVLGELGGGSYKRDLLKGHTQLAAEHQRAALFHAAALVDLEQLAGSRSHSTEEESVPHAHGFSEEDFPVRPEAFCR
jgi:uncharacterized protein (DUF433 family)